MHRIYRGEGFIGGQIGRQVPARRGNGLDRIEYFHAYRVAVDGGALVALYVAVYLRIDAGGGQRLHDPALVRGGDDQPVLRCDQQEAAGPAVTSYGNPVDKVWLLQVDDPSQGADYATLVIEYRDHHREQRNVQFPADDRPTDRRFSLLERSGHGFDVQIVDADPLCRERHFGNRRAVATVGDDAAIEQANENPVAMFQEFLQIRRIAQDGRSDFPGNRCQGAQAVIQFAIDLDGDMLGDCQLLFAEQVFHVRAQHPAGVERQRPHADDEDQQSG